MNKAEIRRNQIMAQLEKEEIVNINELAMLFMVSKETIRLDLNYLEQKGLVVRIHGGAKYNRKQQEVPFTIRMQEHENIKRMLSERILPFIEDDSVIFIASSSTNLALSNLLKLKKNLTIYTNSFELVSMMQDSKHTIMVVGGQYYQCGKRMIGSYAFEMIRNVYFDTCISSMDGCLGLDGPGIKTDIEYSFIRQVLNNSKQKILVADKSKFFTRANYKFATFTDFDIIISEPLDDTTKKAFGDVFHIEVTQD